MKVQTKKAIAKIAVISAVIILWIVTSSLAFLHEAKDGFWHWFGIASDVYGCLLVFSALGAIFWGVAKSQLSKGKRLSANILTGVACLIVVIWIILSILGSYASMYLVIGRLTWDAIQFVACSLLCIIAVALLIVCEITSKSYLLLKAHTSQSLCWILAITSIIFLWFFRMNWIEEATLYTSPDGVELIVTEYSTGDCVVFQMSDGIFAHQSAMFKKDTASDTYFEDSWFIIEWDSESPTLVYYDKNTLMTTSKPLSIKR